MMMETYVWNRMKGKNTDSLLPNWRKLYQSMAEIRPSISYTLTGEGRVPSSISNGGTKDRNSESLRIITAGRFIELLGKFAPEAILHFESGTINFTVNSIYEDGHGCICLESNEIMELDDYPVGMIVEDLSHCSKDTGIYFYDDDSKEYYVIYPDEIRTDEKGDVWIKVR